MSLFLNKKEIQNHVFEFNLDRSIKKFFFSSVETKDWSLLISKRTYLVYRNNKTIANFFGIFFFDRSFITRLIHLSIFNYWINFKIDHFIIRSVHRSIFFYWMAHLAGSIQWKTWSKKRVLLSQFWNVEKHHDASPRMSWTEFK